MPRQASGLPQWKSTAVKLPADLFDELRRYSDIKGVSLSDVLREGLVLRLHGTMESGASNSITPSDTALAVAAQLRRLATVLDGQEQPAEASLAVANRPVGLEHAGGAGAGRDEENRSGADGIHPPVHGG